MEEDEQQHLRVMRQAHIKRLRKLQEQTATLGDATPTHILIEIDDLKESIRELNQQLGLSSPEDTPEKSPLQIPRGNSEPVALRSGASDISAKSRSHKPVSFMILAAVIIIFVVGFGTVLWQQIRTTATSNTNTPPSANVVGTIDAPSTASIATSQTTATTPVPPTSLPTNVGSVNETVVSASEARTNVTSNHELVKIKNTWEFCPISRVLPGYVHPEENEQEALAQVLQSIEDKSYEKWQQAPFGESFKLGSLITSVSQDIERIKLSNTAHVEVIAKDVPDHINVYITGQCAGGSNRPFPPIALDSAFKTYSGSIINTHFDYFSLQTGEFEVFEFTFNCKSPGIYNVRLEVPYELGEDARTITIHNSAELVCPKSYTEWFDLGFNDNTTFDRVKNYVWNGEQYEETPR
jgi:hypothetical protein